MVVLVVVIDGVVPVLEKNCVGVVVVVDWS